jgi:UDP:flavonoid glycosyltransferase YjiC (YdhE family)
VLGAAERTTEAIRTTVRRVLADPAYGRNAERIRDAMAALPGHEHAISLPAWLARERIPLVAAALL